MDPGADNSREGHPRVPRRVLSIALPLGCLALVLVFLLALFPYGRFRDIAISRLAEASGASVSMAICVSLPSGRWARLGGRSVGAGSSRTMASRTGCTP